MEKEEIFKKLQDDFVAAGKKDEFIIVAGALQTGLKPEEVEKYMTSNLNAEQLLEQLAGLLDGLPRQTLSTFASGKTSASDMRQLRIGTRGDTMIEMIMQEVRNISETVLDMNYGKEIASLSKAIRDLKKDIDKMRADIAEGKKEQPVMETIEDLQQMEEREKRKGSFAPDEPPKAEEPLEEGGVNSEAKSSGQLFTQPIGYVNAEKGIIVERKTQSEKAKSVLSFFRRLNSDKIEQDEEKKRLSVMEFVKEGLDEEKLEAVLEAVRFGVPYDHLKYIIDKNSNAEKIRKMTQIYLYLFSSSQTAVAAA